jgi:hypothetical protein
MSKPVVAITAHPTDDNVSFTFAVATGGGAHTSNVLVIDEPHTDEWWEVSTVKWRSVRAGSVVVLQQRLRSAGAHVPGGMDPLADFLPPDPRYRIARAVADEEFHSASSELRSLTYGVVPEGFEQTIPEVGPPRRLLPGHTYKVVVLGRDFGTLVFTAP